MKTDTLYQHGTLALLVPGLLTGTLTMKELLQHGDTGIGTGEGLDGELIILDGKPYQVNSRGEVHVVGDDFTLPFANSHFADYQPLMSVESASKTELNQQILELSGLQNAFFSVKITGTFSGVKTRAVAKSSQPYKSLAETAKQQSVFTRDEVAGTLIGYYSPQLFDGIAVGGFHHHFLADDHTFGGHLLDFTAVTGDVSIQLFSTLEQHLPVDNDDYRQHDFAKDNIKEDVHQAEG
ncbi:alpha-acetolactate decarboxylase [Levilactobacillus koreensis JCM 16448]|uniref:Alpha-acetolactate decarboxylase n=1 Tax=Levilactobacillus koreensis TaxID=637971 RepID=A0AAC8UTE3_9LACO|nr:acetolactate decarboxylase [Levilactobacillus koreensis]AKP63951.1 alpha-acetolactate decarboxylase [Levilactobacillus koreensis]KRK86335.1 alpha-acetolactate decarboxylase [Levilactobacillus koreensis JCM 16448]